MRRTTSAVSGLASILVSLNFLSVLAVAESIATRRPAGHNAGFQSWMADPSSPDNWLGGTGNWSNGADWSAGEPGGSSDVSINTGNDNVTLDVNASINSLTLGGTSGSSTLTSNGNTLTIAGALTINQSGTLVINNFGGVNVDGNGMNAGTINLHGFLSAANFTNSGNIGLTPGVISVTGSLTNSGNIEGGGSNIESVSSGGDFNNSGTVLAYNVGAGGTLTNQSGGTVIAQNLGAANMINMGGVSGLMRGSQMTVTGELTNSGTINSQYGSASFGSLNNLSGGVIWSGGDTVHGNASNAGGIEVASLGPFEPPVFFQINGNLTNSGGLTVSGSPPATASASVGGSVTNSGEIQLIGGGEFSAGGTLTNSGIIVTNQLGSGMPGNSIGAAMLINQTGGVLSLGGMNDVGSFGYVNKAGSISIANGATLQIASTHSPTNALPGFLNGGTVLISSGGTLFSPLTYAQTGGQTTVDGTLHISGHGSVNLAGGSLYGNNGTIQSNVISNANFNIGDVLMTVGQMAIMGNYTQGANGALTFDIASLTQYDQLNVSGRATLNGMMTVDLLNGYIPQIGNMFDIMNFASRSGTFATVLGLPINNQEHFVLEYNSTNLTLDVVAGPSHEASSGRIGPHNDRIIVVPNNDPFITQTMEALDPGGMSYSSSPSSVPEPGSIVLFGSGLAGLATILRRKKII